MSKPSSRGIRAQRQRKAANRWQSLTPVNKKGRDPRQGRPSENRTCGIVEPSQEVEGRQALNPHLA